MSEATLGLVIGVAGIVVGLVAAYIFHRLERKERRPVYVVTGNVVVRADEKRDIEVFHKGTSVPIVTRTVITFWNAGREPIRREDLLENHPLIVKLPKGSDTLEAGVVAATRPEIDFGSFPDPFYADVQFAFSYLNHRDGGAIEILHTGSNPWDVTVEGAIVGVDSPPTRINTPLWDDPIGRVVPFIAFVSAAGLFFAFRPDGWVKAGAAMLVSVGVGVWAWLRSWKADRRRVPAPLRGSLGPAAPPYVKEHRRPNAKLGLKVSTGSDPAVQEAKDDQSDGDRSES